MIDLHCHILPGLDDGAQTMQDSILMARIAVEDGIETLVASPHSFEGIYEVSPEARDLAINEVQAVLDAEGIPLKILPGCECRINEHLLHAIKASPAQSLNLTGNYFLVEWPQDIVPSGFNEFLFEAQISGLVPILCHPERHPEIQKKPEIIGELIERGVQVQITAASLTGLFGNPARRAAEKLLRKGWVNILATDAHNPEIRTPVLSEGLARANNILGRDAIEMVTTNPARVLGLL